MFKQLLILLPALAGPMLAQAEPEACHPYAMPHLIQGMSTQEIADFTRNIAKFSSITLPDLTTADPLKGLLRLHQKADAMQQALCTLDRKAQDSVGPLPKDFRYTESDEVLRLREKFTPQGMASLQQNAKDDKARAAVEVLRQTPLLQSFFLDSIADMDYRRQSMHARYRLAGKDAPSDLDQTVLAETKLALSAKTASPESETGHK